MPAGHDNTHSAEWQLAPAQHRAPQPPQWARLVAVSTHSPSQRDKPGRHSSGTPAAPATPLLPATPPDALGPPPVVELPPLSADPPVPGATAAEPPVPGATAAEPPAEASIAEASVPPLLVGSPVPLPAKSRSVFPPQADSRPTMVIMAVVPRLRIAEAYAEYVAGARRGCEDVAQAPAAPGATTTLPPRYTATGRTARGPTLPTPALSVTPVSHHFPQRSYEWRGSDGDEP